jgi:hypothetical protein
VPCPSALVVLLAAIAFHRITFGLALITAFSFGLAAVLVGIGLAMVYARTFFDRFNPGGRFTRRLGLLSAAVVALLGAGIALKSVPAPLASVLSSSEAMLTGTALSILVLGFLFGLKHATEADHIAAVSAIVSDAAAARRDQSGALWGAGHSVSILAAGLVVLVLNVVIPGSVARVLEFGVALMIIVLGSRPGPRPALAPRPACTSMPRRTTIATCTSRARARTRSGCRRSDHVHELRQVGVKPRLVGMMHGLAGSPR